MKIKLIISLIFLVLPFLNLFGQTPSIEKCDCPFDISKMEANNVWCGKLKVPENRVIKDGRELEIMFTVIEPKDPKPEPIVLMPGGPGIAPVASRFLPIIHGIMPSDHTFIVFDPRGTGLSGPDMCREQRSARAIISSMDLSLDEENLMYKGAMLACRSSLKQDSIDINQYNSVTIAQDVNDLMNALGYKKWNIYGGSYGVPFARMAMRLYPEQIRSVVLSNGGDLNMMNFLKYDRRAMHEALKDVINRCKQNQNCNDRYPNIMQNFYDTYNWLKETPITFEVPRDEFEFPTFTLNSHEFVNFIYFQLFNESRIIHIPAILNAFAKKDLEFIKKVVEYEYGSPSIRFNSGMSTCVECFDHYFPGDQAEQEKFGEGLHPAFSEIPWFTTECDYWLTEVTDSTLMKPFKSEIPTLILYGEHDPTSNRVQAESHIPWFTNVQISKTPGMAHGPPSNRERDCWKDIINGFIHEPFKQIDESCYKSLPQVNISIDLPDWAKGK